MINKSSLFQQPASYIRQMLTTMINDRGNDVFSDCTGAVDYLPAV